MFWGMQDFAQIQSNLPKSNQFCSRNLLEMRQHPKLPMDWTDFRNIITLRYVDFINEILLNFDSKASLL